MRAFLALLAPAPQRRFALAGLVGRAPMAMLGIAIILATEESTGSYSAAGAAAAAYALSQACGAPVAGRLVDVYGQARVLVVGACVHASALVVLAVCVQMRVPVPALLAAASVTGATLPPIGSLVRARWIAVLGRTHQLPTAMAWESAVDELLFVTGPLVVTLLVAVVHPQGGLVVSAVLTLVGGLWLAAQRATAPPLTAGRNRRRAGLALRQPPLALLAAIFLALGAVSGSTGLGIVALADTADANVASGAVLACFAGGAMVGGLTYGAAQPNATLTTQLLVVLAAMSALLAPLSMVADLRVLAMNVFVVGLTIAPAMIVGFAIVGRVAPDDVRTEALAWISAASGAGVALGSGVAGRAAEAGGAVHALAVPLVCGVTALAVALAGRSPLQRSAVPAQDPEVTVA
ncbi:MFS transporter [Micromonospora sp. CPCC 205539]|uniref:MFS transporter n=1 Tax=Micromonospora sp. CPCC 205539 TaxID=3122408 RepID=UPI002FF1E8A6